MSFSAKKQYWIVSGLLFFVFAVGFLTLPAQNYGFDPLASREEARSLVDRGILEVDKTVAQKIGAPGQFFVYNYSNGKAYAKYGIFTTLVDTVPLYIEKIINGNVPFKDPPNRMFIQGIFYVIISMGIAYELYILAGYYSRSERARVTYVLLAFYTTYLWYYLRSTTSESLILGCLLLFYIFFLRFVRSKKSITERFSQWNIYGAWFALLLALHTRIYLILVVVVFVLALLYYMRKEHLSKQEWFRVGVRIIVLPSILILLSLGIVQWIKFGSPFLSGYHQWWDKDIPHTLWNVLYDFIFSAQWSFFVNFPLLIVALFGMRRFVGRYREEAIFLGSIFLIFLAYIQHLSFWRGEWAYGPRYFVFLLPLLSLPALYVLEWLYVKPYHVRKIIVSVFIFSASIFLIFVQMQVNRSHYFLKYYLQSYFKSMAAETQPVVDYFNTTPYAKISWDHITLQNNWNALPYVKTSTRQLSPKELKQLKRQVDNTVQASNLYWFPNINKR